MNCSRWTRTLVVLASLALTAPASSWAQGDEETLKLDFQNAELADVIKSIAKSTKRNFLFDDRVRGTVTVISEQPVTMDEAFRVFEAVLQVKGFSIVDGPGGIQKIIPTREAPTSPLPLEREGALPSERDRFITRLIPLKYVKVDAISDTFRQLSSKDANIIAYAPTNTLILTDNAANIRRVLNIIREIDVETYEEQIKVIPLEFADATELTSQLQEIFSSTQPGAATPGAGGATAAARARAAARAAAAAAAANGGAAAGLGATSDTVGLAGEPRFIPDARTNSIIVLAPQGTIRQVERLVTLLDYNRPGTGRINIISLQNADAEETAETLSRLVEGASSSAASSSLGGGGTAAPDGAAGGGGGGGIVELAGGVRITADAPTNSLIIQSSPEAFASLQGVIKELDKRRPQVLIEALIMEVQVNDGEQFGTQLIFNTLLGGGDNPVQRLGGFGTNPVGGAVPQPPLNSSQPITTMMNGMMSTVTSSGIGSPVSAPFLGTILGNTVSIVNPDGTVSRLPVIQAVINAAANNNDIDIINAPKILTADNEEAQIVVGQEIGFPTTNLQIADQTSGFQTSSNVERRDVGVTLRVTPQISEGDTIKLEFFQEVSSVSPQQMNSAQLGLTTSNRTVENTVFVKDGEAVLIGGIIQDQLTYNVTKVPFLGDLPVFGFFFRSTAENVVKTNLMVILTPRIVRDPNDLRQLTIEKREEFRSLAGNGMEFTEEEMKQRQLALEAGIDLPLDPNPVRRTLTGFTTRYPTETLNDLREENQRAEDERKRELEEQSRAPAAGRYVVQVASLRDPMEAAKLLQQLVADGYTGMVMSRMEGGDAIHIVQLGPYTSEDKAQRVSREIQAELGFRAAVMITSTQ